MLALIVLLLNTKYLLYCMFYAVERRFVNFVTLGVLVCFWYVMNISMLPMEVKTSFTYYTLDGITIEVSSVKTNRYT